MPVYEIQHGDRTFEIEADSEPSPESLDFALKQFVPSSNPVADMARRAVKAADTGAKHAFSALANAADTLNEKFGLPKTENSIFRTHADQAAKDAAAITTDSARDSEIKSMIAEGVGSAIPAITAGLASPVLGMATVSAQSAEATRAKALAEGDSPELAAEKAKLGRLGGAVMGIIPGNAARPGAKIVERVASGVGTGAYINALQESVMETATEGKTNPEGQKRAAIVGGAMGGAFGAASGKAKRGEETPAEAAPVPDKAVETINAGIREDAAKPGTEPVNKFTPAEIASEVSKTPPDALENIKAQVARGDEVDYQYSVWDKEAVPEGKPRDLQIDIIPKNPDEANAGGLGSTNRKVLAALGVDLPPVPDWVPPGSYTKADMEALIAQGPPPAGSEVVFEPAPKAQPLDTAPEPSVSAPPEVGLGGASPKEFQPVSEFSTSVKNEVVDKERADRGLPPAMSEASKTLGKTWEEAMARIDDNQNAPDELIAEIQKKPRAATDVETAILLHRRIELRNQFDKATRNLDEQIGTPDSLASDLVTQQRALEDLAALDEVTRATGRETGLGLNARKLVSDQDYSLASMLTDRRAARGGSKLTEEEIAAVKEVRAAIDAAEKELAEATTPEGKAMAEAKSEKAKGDFDNLLDQDRNDLLTGIQRVAKQTVGTYDAARNLMTTGELSFILRQGKIAAASHPIMTAKALPRTFQALFGNELTARALDIQTRNEPMAAQAIKNGVHFVEEGASLSKREEAFASKLADKLPGLRNFNQAGRVFLNKLRVDLYKAMAGDRELTPEQGKALANYVNEATGRGSLGSLERSAVTMSRVFFAPRYVASRIQYAVGHSMWGGDLTTRRIIAKEYAKTLVGLGVYYASLTAALNALNADEKKKPTIESDPRSTEFGKIKMGNTRLDPLAGLAQVIVFGARTATGERKDAKGRIASLREDAKFGQQRWTDVASNFVRSKLHPIPGTIVDLFNGTDLAGQPVTLKSEAGKMVVPLTYTDVYQALEEQDLPPGVALSLLAFLGEGLQTYDATHKKPAPRQTIPNTEQTLPSGKKVNVRPAK